MGRKGGLKSPAHFGFLFAAGLMVWWIAGMVYTLGHTIFTGLIPQGLYNALSYPVAGPFIFISEYLLSGRIYLLYHLLLVFSLGFVAGILYGQIRKSLLR